MFKLISVTAVVFRFVNNLNKLQNNERNLIINDEHLTLDVLKTSFDKWIKNEQILILKESHLKQTAGVFEYI